SARAVAEPGRRALSPRPDRPRPRRERFAVTLGSPPRSTARSARICARADPRLRLVELEVQGASATRSPANRPLPRPARSLGIAGFRAGLPVEREALRRRISRPRASVSSALQQNRRQQLRDRQPVKKARPWGRQLTTRTHLEV